MLFFLKFLHLPKIRSLIGTMSSNYVINLENGFVELCDDINVFLPNKGPQSCEILIKGSKENEVRKEIRAENFDGTSKCIGRLQMKYLVRGKETCFVGSATLVWVGKAPWQKFFLITCAHNVLREGWQEKHFILQKPIRTTFYRGLDNNKWLSRHQVSKIFVPSTYKDKLVESQSSAACLNTGYDYAICMLTKEDCLTQLDLPYLLSFANELKDDDELTITGYPAEYQTQWTDCGVAKTVKRKKFKGAIVIYDTVDTTPGQSGSPVLANGKLVGIHIGELGDCNIATLITAQVKDWIYSHLWNFLNAQPGKMDERLEQCLRAESPDYCDEKEQLGLGSASICFLGRTGCGKSTLLNALAPGANAAVSRSNFSVTEKVTTYTEQWFDKDGVGHFIDVPGFGDSGNEEDCKNRDRQFSKDVYDHLKCCDRISCFVIVICGRGAGTTCAQMIKFYRNLLQLNDDLWRYVVFVKTQVDYTIEIKLDGGVTYWEEDLKRQEVELREMIKKKFKVNDPQVVCIGNLWNKNGKLLESDIEVRNVITCKLIDIKDKALGNWKLGGMSMDKIQLAMLPEQFLEWQAGVAKIKSSLTSEVTHIMGRENLEEILLSLFNDKKNQESSSGPKAPLIIEEATAKVTNAIDLTLSKILSQWADFLGTSTGKKVDIKDEVDSLIVKFSFLDRLSTSKKHLQFIDVSWSDIVRIVSLSIEDQSKIVVKKVIGYFDRITSQIINRNEF